MDSKRKKIERGIKNLLNSNKSYLSKRSLSSPRAAGDAIADIISENFQTILGRTALEYAPQSTRKSMHDLAYKDKAGNTYYVDVKTHRLDTKFNMPNLTSVKKLSGFYELDNNYFIIAKIDYLISNKQVVVKKVTFAPIEYFDWSCLTVGALGWGQIQIANANIVNLSPDTPRHEWMIELYDHLCRFYPNEIRKAQKRLAYFKIQQKLWKERISK